MSPNIISKESLKISSKRWLFLTRTSPTASHDLLKGVLNSLSEMNVAFQPSAHPARVSPRCTAAALTWSRASVWRQENPTKPIKRLHQICSNYFIGAAAALQAEQKQTRHASLRKYSLLSVGCRSHDFWRSFSESKKNLWNLWKPNQAAWFSRY